MYLERINYTIDSSVEPTILWFPKKKKKLCLNPLTKQAQYTKYLDLNINSKRHITSQNDIIL